MKIFLSFIGDNDLPEVNPEGGAVMNVFRHLLPDKVYLFYNINVTESLMKYLRGATVNLDWMRKVTPDIQHGLIKIVTDDPTDFEVLYPIMNHEVQNIIEENGYEGNEYYIGIASGTPTMQFVWILLKEHGLVRATLLRSIEEKHQRLHGGKPYVEVNLNLDDFPQIQSPSSVKRQLTIVSREKDRLSGKLRINKLNEAIPSLIGQSKSILDIKEQILEEVESSTHVLILGERGTGKQIVAQEIWRLYHKEGDDMLTTFDCGTIPESLIESELFGHKRGAFTGATGDKEGLLEICSGRMVFLDEIGNLPMVGQNALLRYLQFGEIRRVGETHVRSIETQVIAATNRVISDPTLFAPDFRDRFDEVVVIPPLRERKNDIPILAEYFTRIHSQNGRLILSQDIIEKLQQYDWSGNVRELEMWIKKLVRKYGARELTLKDLPARIVDVFTETDDELPIPSFPFNLNEYVEQIKLRAIEEAGDNFAQADRLLGYSLGAIKQWMHQRRKRTK